MKCASWSDCLELSSAVKISQNKQKAMSLMKVSENRIKVMNLRLNEDTCNYIFEDYYSSILELLQSLIFLYGYKTNNHICLGFFLRDFLKKDDLFRAFDDCRFKRNSLVYYGEKMDFETAKNSIERSKVLIIELRKLLEIKLKENK